MNTKKFINSIDILPEVLICFMQEEGKSYPAETCSLQRKNTGNCILNVKLNFSFLIFNCSRRYPHKAEKVQWYSPSMEGIKQER